MNFNFDTVDMKEEIVTAFKTELPKFGFGKVKVLKSDPQGQAELPCVGINRASDDETNMSIGDSHGVSYDASTKVYATEQGTFFSETMEVRVWHTNADERDKLYRTVKAILFAYRLEWVKKGVLNISMRGGRDEQDSTMQNAPTVMYWGVVNLAYLNPMNVDILETVEPISAVTDKGTLTVDLGGTTSP